MANGTYSRSEFAQKIKSKYPQYAEMDDNELVDKIVAKYPQYGEQISEKPAEPETTEATPAPADTVSESEVGSSEPQEPQQTEEELAAEREQERATKELAYRSAKAAIPGAASIVANLPDFLLEPYAAFEGTLLGFVPGVQKFVSQQAARFDDTKYKVNDLGELEKSEDDSGQTAIELLQEAKPEDRMKLWESYSEAGDLAQDVVDAMHGLAEEHGSGSITEELAKGNIGNAVQLTANQTAAGLASLVPFLVPGGQVIGPAVLGTSATASSFEEDLGDVDKTRDATINDIYNASYIKGGSEFATELVTAGIIGKAKKMASAGAGKAAVNEYTKSATRRVLGDAFAEGISEGLTDTVSKITDSVIYGSEFNNRDAVVGFLDSAIVGAIVGGKVSTFGQTAAKENARRLAANALASDSHKQAKEDLAEDTKKQIKIKQEAEADGLEGSLINQVTVQTAEKKIADNNKAAEKLENDLLKNISDATTDELNVLADAKQKIEAAKSEKAKLEKRDENADTEVLDNAIQEYEQQYDDQYSKIANYDALKDEVNRVVELRKEAKQEKIDKIEDLKLKNKEMAKHEQPNPITKRKNDREITKLEKEVKEEDTVTENLESLPKISRPTHVDTKHKKAPAKPKEGAAALPTEVKNADQREVANEELNNILSDESLPSVQKERAISRAISINKPRIIVRAKKLGDRYPQVDKKKIERDLETEAAKRIFKSGKVDENTWNTAEANVRNLIRKELEIKKRPKESEELKERLTELRDQFNEGVIQDPQLYDELVNQAKEEFAPVEDFTGKEELTSSGEGGAIIENPEVSKKIAERETTPTESQKVKEYNRIVEGTNKESRDNHIDEMMNESNFRNNIPNLYKLLPESYHTKGWFKDGNKPVEDWMQRFDRSTDTGRRNFNRLKNAIKDNVDNAIGQTASTDNLLDSQVKDDSFDYLEKKPAKTDVKRFLPLLGMLKRSFPEVKVIISKGRMMEDFIEAGIDPGKADNVKGYTDGNTVVLNPEKLDYETPIHEFGHIWAQATRQLRPDLYAKGVELVKKSPYYLETLEKSKDTRIACIMGIHKPELKKKLWPQQLVRLDNNSSKSRVTLKHGTLYVKRFGIGLDKDLA